MKYSNVFHLISEISKKSGITCVLIGGFAVNYYKHTRQTTDADFLVTKEDFEKISNFLKEEGYAKGYSEDVFIQLKSNKPYLLDIDFMFVDKETLSDIMSTGKEIGIAGQTFVVPSLFNLIALKLHSIKYNPQLRKVTDLPDIINLIRKNGIDFKSGEFHEMCLKYGSEEIYKEITESV